MPRLIWKYWKYFSGNFTLVSLFDIESRKHSLWVIVTKKFIAVFVMQRKQSCFLFAFHFQISATIGSICYVFDSNLLEIFRSIRKKNSQRLSCLVMTSTGKFAYLTKKLFLVTITGQWGTILKCPFKVNLIIQLKIKSFRSIFKILENHAILKLPIQPRLDSRTIIWWFVCYIG